jgi:hypothetical protein
MQRVCEAHHGLSSAKHDINRAMSVAELEMTTVAFIEIELVTFPVGRLVLIRARLV